MKLTDLKINDFDNNIKHDFNFVLFDEINKNIAELSKALVLINSDAKKYDKAIDDVNIQLKNNIRNGN